MFHTLLQATTDVTTGIDPLMVNLTSLGSVVFVATLIVQRIVKPLTGKYPTSLGRLPTMAYLVPIACALTYIANRYMFTLPGDNVFRLIRDTVVTIFMSQGFYTSPEALKPIKDTKSQGALLKKDNAPTVEQQGKADIAAEKSQLAGDWTRPPQLLILLTLIPALLLTGCSMQHSDPVFYTGVSQGWPPIRDTYNRYVDNDATLDDEQRGILRESSKSMDALIRAEGLRQQPAPTTQP